MPNIVPIENITDLIYLIRGKKVILDRDLAQLYGVSTKVLNQAVKRKALRFPQDFMFQLTKKEKDELVTNCDRFQMLKHSSALPHAFTEQGVAMLSSVLNSDQAVLVNIRIMRTFVQLRHLSLSHEGFSLKLKELEDRIENHDDQILAAFEDIKKLLSDDKKAATKIGYLKEKQARFGKHKGM